MEHVVFYPSADGAAAFRRVASLDDAVRFVEHLRNVEDVSEFSVHELTAVPLSFRAYYRAELPAQGGISAAAAVPVDPGPAVVADQPADDEPAEALALVRPLEDTPATAAVTAAPVAESATVAVEASAVGVPAATEAPTAAAAADARRSLSFFAS